MSGFSEPEIGTGPVGNPNPASKSETPKSETFKTIEALEKEIERHWHDPDPNAIDDDDAFDEELLRRVLEEINVHLIPTIPQHHGFVPGHPGRVYRAA